ncbi:hypothetical protein DYB31_002146 [Aphanomyces astaci]|uniref:MaoC-like domain-containing protein n=1 Tax=Aphanomyces astaci TaxID=112090 RepID=A0A397FYY4_APHAT|nr:hypothetical protein DYB31_002146 [Aphanomyces astaci]
MKKVNEKRAVNAVNLPKLSTTSTDGEVTPRRPPRLPLDSPSSSETPQPPLALTPILGLDGGLTTPTKPVALLAPTTPSKQSKGQSLRARKLEDQQSPSHQPPSAVLNTAQLYDPTSSSLLNPAFEVDMTLLEAEVEKMKQLGQAAEGHVEAIYANNTKERMFFRQASVQEKQAWGAEKVEFEALLVVKETELHTNERERAKLSDTLTQTIQYFTHEVESRDRTIAVHVTDLQTTRDVLASTEHSLRQSQMQHQRTVDTLAKHVDELDVTKSELAGCRQVVAQHEVTMANQSKHILATEASLAQARTAIAYVCVLLNETLSLSLEAKCVDQKGTLHAYKEEMHGYVFNVDQLRRDVKLGQDKQDELTAAIKTHEKTIASFKRQQAKWEAAKAAHDVEQSEQRAMTKVPQLETAFLVTLKCNMYKERIDAQAKMIHRQEESIVASTVAHVADFTTIDLQTAQLKSLARTVGDQSAYIAKLETTCRAAEIQHLKNRSLIELLQTKIHGLDDTTVRQDKETASLLERLAKRDGVVAARDAEVAALKAAYESMSAELMGQVETNQAAIAVHIAVIASMRATQEELVATKSQLKADLDLQTARANDLDVALGTSRREFAISEDNFTKLSLRHSVDEAHYIRTMEDLVAWTRATLDERGLELSERNQVLREASEDAAATLTALQTILDETNAMFAACQAQARATAADYEAKVIERTEALEQQEERIHLLEIQLKMNAEQANQRRQTLHEDRQREMAQFQMQLKGKEDVFEIELSRLKTQLQQERATALAQLTTLQETSELDMSKVQSLLQQERTTSAATIAQLEENGTKLTLERAQLRDDLAHVRAVAAQATRTSRDQLGMLAEEVRGVAYAVAAAEVAQDKLVQQHDAFVANLRVEHEESVTRLHASHIASVTSLQGDHANAMAAQVAQQAAAAKQFQVELATLQATHTVQVEAAAEDAQRQRLELEAKLQYQKETLTVQLKASKLAFEEQLVEQRIRLECLIEHQRDTLEGQLRDQVAHATARDAAACAAFDEKLLATKTDLEGELAKQRAGYEIVISQQRERYEATIRQRKERYELDVATQRAELESTLATTKARLEGELADITLRLGTELRTTKEALETDLATQKAFYESTLRTTKETLESENVEVKTTLEGRLVAVQSTLEGELVRQKERLEGQIAHQTQVFELEMANQRRRFEAQIADQKTALEGQIMSQRMEYEAEILRQRTDLETSMKQQVDVLERQVASTRAVLEGEVVRQKSEFENEIAEQRGTFEAQLGALDADLSGQVREWEAKYTEDTTAMRAKFEHDLSSQRTELEGALASQKEILESDLLTQKQTLEAKLARQEDTFDTQMADKCRRYNLDMEAQVNAFEKHMAERNDAWEAAVLAQSAQFDSQLQALVQQAEQDQAVAKVAIDGWEIKTSDLERVTSLRIAELESDIATLEAHVAQCYTGDFLLTRIKMGLRPLIQDQFHPNVAEHVAGMTTLDDLDALLAMLLALAVECQTFVQLGPQRLGMDVLRKVVDEHDELWANVPDNDTCHRDIRQVIFHTKEHTRLLHTLPRLVPELAPSVDAALEYISAYQSLRRDAAPTLTSTEIVIFEHLDTYHACLSQGKAILAAESGDVDTVTLLRHVDAYDQLRTRVAGAIHVPKETVDNHTILQHVQEWSSLRDHVAQTLSPMGQHKTSDSDSDVRPTAATIGNVVDAHVSMLREVAGVWGVIDDTPIAPSRIVATLQEYHTFREDAAAVLQLSPVVTLSPRDVIATLVEYAGLCKHAANQLELKASRATPRDITDVLDTYQTLRADSGASVPVSSKRSSAKDILAWVNDYHALRSRVSVLLSQDGGLCTSEDVVAVVQTYLELAVKHRDLVRAKMAIEANNNALTGSLDVARQALQDLEVRSLDRKLQDGKDFETAFHRRKQVHEQDNAAHATAVDTLRREAAVAMDALRRDLDTVSTSKRQDAERSGALALAAAERARALEVEDVKTASARQFDDLQRSTACQLESLQRDLTNIRAIKLKEQADYDATMDAIRRALEVQATETYGRRDGGEKAAFFARYVDRDRMLMELVYGAIRSVTQLLSTSSANKAGATMPTELSHAILGCIKELKRMKEYVMGSFDALQKDMAPFLPFEVTWHAVEWQPDMDLATWCVESCNKTNEHARMQFQQFLAHANSTMTMLAATQRERAMEVLAFMRRGVAPCDTSSQDKDASMLKMRLMDAVTDRDQVGLELQLKETFFTDLLHQHKAVAADMHAKLSQQQQLWKAMMASSSPTLSQPPRSPTMKPLDDQQKLTMVKPGPKPKWQEDDPTTTVLSNGRTLKERFVSDLALETGQNPPMKRGQTVQVLRPPNANAGDSSARKISQPYVSMAATPSKHIQSSSMHQSSAAAVHLKPGNDTNRQQHLWYQGVKQIDGQSLSLALGYVPTRNSLVLDVFNTDTEYMQAIEVNPKLLQGFNKPLVPLGVLPEVGVTASIDHVFHAADVETFAALSGDSNPVHVDAAFAATTTFGKPVVHGILCTSLFPTIFGATFPGAIYVAQDVRYHKPIHVGDLVHAEIEVLQVKARMRLVVCATRCLDRHGDVAISGQAKVLLPKPTLSADNGTPTTTSAV